MDYIAPRYTSSILFKTRGEEVCTRSCGPSSYLITEFKALINPTADLFYEMKITPKELYSDWSRAVTPNSENTSV